MVNSRRDFKMSSRDSQIEVMARGVCVRDRHLLVCHTRGAKNTYLPGGHVEFRESAPDALEREIREELGLSSRVRGFLGAIEHEYRQKGRIHCEINLVFFLDLEDIAKLPPERSGQSPTLQKTGKRLVRKSGGTTSVSSAGGFASGSLALGVDEPPVSCEGHLDFRWIPLIQLRRSDLEPAPLREMIGIWVRQGVSPACWAGTVGG
jgi:8-oxo-dGTP pyrophosphatase MutT (NUDIX family)